MTTPEPQWGSPWPPLTRAELHQLKVEHDGRFWWCQESPATSSEHKFKAADLAGVMGDDDLLFWGSSESPELVPIRGKNAIRRDRYGKVKFPKSLCERCNNARSQPMDLAYDIFSEYVRKRPGLGRSGRLNFTDIFGTDWHPGALNLARYYVKHFGCRVHRDHLAIPPAMRSFLDGGEDLPCIGLSLVYVRSTHPIHRVSSFGMSKDFIQADRDPLRIAADVFASYFGHFGVRYEWRATWDNHPDVIQFFDRAAASVYHFDDEWAMFDARARRPGLLDRLRERAQGNRRAANG